MTSQVETNGARARKRAQQLRDWVNLEELMRDQKIDDSTIESNV